MNPEQDKFNRYCAEVMGYELVYDNFFGCEVWKRKGMKLPFDTYNPFDDLNQMAEVVDALINTHEYAYEIDVFGGAKKAMRDFIISTMPEEKDK